MKRIPITTSGLTRFQSALAAAGIDVSPNGTSNMTVSELGQLYRAWAPGSQTAVAVLPGGRLGSRPFSEVFEIVADSIPPLLLPLPPASGGSPSPPTGPSGCYQRRSV